MSESSVKLKAMTLTSDGKRILERSHSRANIGRIKTPIARESKQKKEVELEVQGSNPIDMTK